MDNNQINNYISNVQLYWDYSVKNIKQVSCMMMMIVLGTNTWDYELTRATAPAPANSGHFY